MSLVCHVSPDNTFGEGFDWESAPWFDANGLNDVAPMQASTVVQQLQISSRHKLVGINFCY